MYFTQHLIHVYFLEKIFSGLILKCIACMTSYSCISFSNPVNVSNSNRDEYLLNTISDLLTFLVIVPTGFHICYSTFTLTTFVFGETFTVTHCFVIWHPSISSTFTSIVICRWAISTNFSTTFCAFGCQWTIQWMGLSSRKWEWWIVDRFMTWAVYY